MQRYTRSIAEIWRHWETHARQALHPMAFTSYEDHQGVFAKLTSLDREAWAAAYGEAARPYEERARAAEARGDMNAAGPLYLHAYGLYRMARYPAPNSPGKRAAYRKSQEMYLLGARSFPFAVERVEMPFRGRAGEGTASVGYLMRPKGAGRLPLVIAWGGIDSFKEDRSEVARPLIAAGLSVLLIDMPGTGDAPLAGSEDAERLWDAVLDWCAARPEIIDEKRIAAWGGSTGGYWAAKIAHTHRARLAAAVCHGGCAHHAFTPEWIEKAQHGSYMFELAETLACAFGGESFEYWVDYCPRLSLLKQGVIDRPSTPLLLVNGVEDSIFPIEDMYLLLQHGGVKAARFYPTGHMGYTPETIPTIVEWIGERLRA